MQMIHVFEAAGLGKAPYKFLGVRDGGNCCHYCGHGIRYEFMLKSADNKEFIVGSECINKSGDSGLKSIVKEEKRKMDRLKREAKKQKAREERQAQRQAMANQKIEAFMSNYAHLKDAFDWASQSTGIALDLWNKLQQWGNLSEKQIELLCDLHKNSMVQKTKCPNGQMSITGTIVSLKWVDNRFGYRSEQIQKMLVQSDEGYKVFGTVPSSLTVEKGDKVSFDALIEQSQQDEYFGLFFRPTKAKCLEVVV